MGMDMTTFFTLAAKQVIREQALPFQPRILIETYPTNTKLYFDSIEFTKEYFINGEYAKVAVRVSSSNIYYARSMYILNPHRIKNFIAKGTLKKVGK